MVDDIIEEESNKFHRTTNVDILEERDEELSVVTLAVPYGGKEGEQLMNKLKKIEGNNSDSRKKVKVRIVYTAEKHGARFPVKDRIPDEHLHNVVYHATCPNKNCKSCYTGETKCRMQKRNIQHNSKDEKSHILIHSKKTKHRRVWMKDFKILGRGYSSDFKRKISEALFIKKMKPDLNIQKEALKLKLYN